MQAAFVALGGIAALKKQLERPLHTDADEAALVVRVKLGDVYQYISYIISPCTSVMGRCLQFLVYDLGSCTQFAA